MHISLGFDKSNYDGSVDWNVAKSRKIDWITLRASYGLDTDLSYKETFSDALAVGTLIAPYHYYHPRKDPIRQASVFLSMATTSNLPPMLDLEDYQNLRGYVGIWKKELKPWLDAVERVTGVRPFIYTSPSYAKTYLAKDTEISEYPLILANYEVNAPPPVKPWTPLGIVGWQYRANADAKYYGFLESKGCALQVFYNIYDYKVDWSVPA